MASGDKYRTKAAMLSALARDEASHSIRSDLEKLAHGYLRLAEQADKNSLADIVYEPSSASLGRPGR